MQYMIIIKQFSVNITELLLKLDISVSLVEQFHMSISTRTPFFISLMMIMVPTHTAHFQRSGTQSAWYVMCLPGSGLKQLADNGAFPFTHGWGSIMRTLIYCVMISSCRNSFYESLKQIGSSQHQGGAGAVGTYETMQHFNDIKEHLHTVRRDVEHLVQRSAQVWIRTCLLV